MEYIEATVKYLSSRTNFVSLPPSVVSMLYNANISPSDVICELVWTVMRKDVKYAYCGWSGYGSTDSDKVEVDPIFALALNLKETTKITINLQMNNYNIAKTVELEPLTTSDWELVELNAGVLENNLLYQTRCIAQDQVIVVFPSGNTNAKLKILNFEPHNANKANKPLFAKIVNDTEFHIKPKTAKKPEARSKSRKTSSNRSRLGRDKVPSILLRGIALPHDLYGNVNEDKWHYEVYLNFDECMNTFHGQAYVNVSVLQGPKLEKTKVDKDLDEKPLQDSEKVVAKLVHCSTSPESHVGLSELLATALGVRGVGNLIVLESVSKPLSIKPDTIIIHPFIHESEPSSLFKLITMKAELDIDKKLQQQNENNEKSAKLSKLIKSKYSNEICLTNYCKILAIDDLLPHGGMIEFNKIGEGWIEKFDIQNGVFQIGANLVRPIPKPTTPTIANVVGQDKLILSMVQVLKRCNVGALLYGNPGSGKTVVSDTVAQKLSQIGVHIQLVNCESLSTESPANILKKLDTHFKEISWYSPSLLILENCDLITPGEQEHMDNFASRQVAEYLVSQLLNRTMKRRRVGVLFTAKDKSMLNSVLFSSHLIEEEFHLKSPDKELRSEVMLEFIRQLQIEQTNTEFLRDIAVETEGYLPGDLKILVDRAQYQMMSQSVATGEEITEFSKEHFDNALKDYTPSMLKGVKLQKSTVKWDEIGGLRQAKSILLETLEWPTKYAPIFASCPLRLRSGILLYGYPGCGKTLLASAVASQCGLNFISIKGPEILNKYIGASEQSVRELFDRAQLAKPCILFFDEFDSILPKRGHDSTGVTDRVVNQMLTHMDGAEGLDGVYVLAATSRPDLIDSALLRPGRLDKSVLCDIPDYEDRVDILQCIVSKMDLQDVNIEAIAEQTEGFSGADLQALGYNAYLQAVHDKLDMSDVPVKDVEGVEFFQLMDKTTKLIELKRRLETTKKLENIFHRKDESEVDQSHDSKVLITQEHFLQSLTETKLSISTKEKLKLSNIYNQFLQPNEREGVMPDGVASSEIGGRTTLM